MGNFLGFGEGKDRRYLKINISEHHLEQRHEMQKRYENNQQDALYRLIYYSK
jgi:hypothetical protein